MEIKRNQIIKNNSNNKEEKGNMNNTSSYKSHINPPSFVYFTSALQQCGIVLNCSTDTTNNYHSINNNTSNSSSSSSSSSSNIIEEYTVLCDDPFKSIRKLESELRLQKPRFKEFLEGMEYWVETSIRQGLVLVQPLSSIQQGIYLYQSLINFTTYLT
jgi:hypothetical protein